MSEITLTGLVVRGCTHCGGNLELVKPRTLEPFRRCTTCGRDDRVRVAGSGLSAPTITNEQRPPSPSEKCSVDGCPGFHAPRQSCPCCEARATYLEKRDPKAPCDICGGLISPKYGRKYCPACLPIVKADSVARSKARSRA